MPKWFERAFGAVAQEVSTGLADVRDKLVFESFFGRHVPEKFSQDDLGWTRDDHPKDPARSAQHEQEQGHDFDR
jgi:hypothetical protein